jgi:hypothetical protein
VWNCGQGEGSCTYETEDPSRWHGRLFVLARKLSAQRLSKDDLYRTVWRLEFFDVWTLYDFVTL